MSLHGPMVYTSVLRLGQESLHWHTLLLYHYKLGAQLSNFFLTQASNIYHVLLTSCLEFSCFRHEMLWKLLFAHTQIPRGRLEAMEEDRQSYRLSVGLTSCTSLAKADLTPAPIGCPTCGQHVSTLSPQPGFVPQGTWLASWWQVNYLSTISTSGRAAEHSY